MTDTLAARLREAADKADEFLEIGWAAILRAAADRLDAQQARIEQLEKAVGDIEQTALQHELFGDLALDMIAASASRALLSSPGAPRAQRSAVCVCGHAQTEHEYEAEGCVHWDGGRAFLTCPCMKFQPGAPKGAQ